MRMNVIYGLTSSLESLSKSFTKKLGKQTPPPPKGKNIHSSSSWKKTTNVFQGYHVTEYSRISDQIKNEKFDNRNAKIYWYPKLEPKKKLKSPLMFGARGDRPGCWNCKDPVIVKIGSNQLPKWDHTYEFPYFPPGKDQRVQILDVWKCNEEWLKIMRKKTTTQNVKE